MAEFALPANSKIGVGETYKAAAGTKNIKVFKVYRWSADDVALQRRYLERLAV